MLLIAKKLNELSFGKLMKVYEESNLENALEFWPHEPQGRQLALAEEGFYEYLSGGFFTAPGVFYAVWVEDGRYVSALRMEPYQDGLLLEALETAPTMRRRGFAKTLILETLAYVGHGKIYSHISKRNIGSLRTHERCGFRKVLDHAVYVDGSVLTSSVTMLIER